MESNVFKKKPDTIPLHGCSKWNCCMIKTDGFLNDTSEKLPLNYLCVWVGRAIHRREYSVGCLHTTGKNINIMTK